MGVHSGLVFGKESRIFHFADVMIQCSGTYQLAFGSDTYRSFSSQIGHLHGVLEGTRNSFGHSSQQIIVDVR